MKAEVIKNAELDSVEIVTEGSRSERMYAEERAGLILEYLPKVRRIALRIRCHLPANTSLDDLVSAGTLGLISAVDHFDPSYQSCLATYAEHKIKGSILDSLRQLDWAPRAYRKQSRQIMAAIALLEQRLQRSPTEKEIANELDLPITRYHEWLLNVSGLNLLGLEWAGSDDSGGDRLSVIPDNPNGRPTALIESRELQRVLAAAIAGLPDIDQTVLNLHYKCDLKIQEMSTILGFREQRISHIKLQAIARLHAVMAKLWPAGRLNPFAKARQVQSRRSAQAQGGSTLVLS